MYYTLVSGKMCVYISVWTAAPRLVAKGNRVRDPISGRNGGSRLIIDERVLLLPLFATLVQKLVTVLSSFLPRVARRLELFRVPLEVSVCRGMKLDRPRKTKKFSLPTCL